MNTIAGHFPLSLFRMLCTKWTRASLVSCLTLALLLAACAVPLQAGSPPEMSPEPFESTTPSPLPSQALVPTGTPVASSTVTLTSRPKTSTVTPISLQASEPLVKAPEVNFGLRFDLWSPDSRWLAYWVGERADNRPAQLAFTDILSGQTCPHPEVIAASLSDGNVYWQTDGRVAAFLSGQNKTLEGAPCTSFTPVENNPIPDLHRSVYLSPDGHYRAEVAILGWQEELIYKEAKIYDLKTDQVVAFVPFNGGAAIMSVPIWLTNQLFLIGKTLDQGILYVGLPGGQARRLLPDLLKLDAENEDQIWRIDGYAEPAKGEYHLLLVGLNGSTGSPLLLYHSEIGRLEEVPFYSAWFFTGTSFSPDGKWLFVGDPLKKGKPGESMDYWLRPVDPPGSAGVEITDNRGAGGLSVAAEKMVFWKDSLIDIYSFPGSQLLNEVTLPGYIVNSTVWSPNGRWLLAAGLPGIESMPEALFLIPIP